MILLQKLAGCDWTDRQYFGAAGFDPPALTRYLVLLAREQTRPGRQSAYYEGDKAIIVVRASGSRSVSIVRN